jgi:hypothetical protein
MSLPGDQGGRPVGLPGLVRQLGHGTAATSTTGNRSGRAAGLGGPVPGFGPPWDSLLIVHRCYPITPPRS